MARHKAAPYVLNSGPVPREPSQPTFDGDAGSCERYNYDLPMADPSLLRRSAVALPTVLLLAVASVQMILARTADLSPWKGGGFGMFASVDGLGFRSVRLFVFAPERSEEIEVAPSLSLLAQRVATFPHRRAMEELARAVIAREQRLERPVETVRVEIWRAQVSPSLDVTRGLVRETTVAVHETDRERGR